MTAWTFAPAGKEEHGFHNPGVETFKGNLERYLAREVIQNSVDAREDAKRPVHVSFDLEKDAKVAGALGLGELAKTFGRCSDYVKGDKQAEDFFGHARQLASLDRITFLRIGDTNTSGVSGSDTDRRDGWYSLVICSGSSPKGSGEGGSFGLGKHASFAASPLRTVVYSTRTPKGSCAFQGVARLVTHEGPRGKKLEPTGYFGGADGGSIRKKIDIPKPFLRTEPGTDVCILGYEADADWKEQFIHSVLSNFWPALHRKTLTASIGGTRIDAVALPKLMAEYAQRKDFDAHLYYRAYTDPAALEINETLPTLGKTTVRLLPGDLEFPNQVAMIRRTGMVIYTRRTRSRVRFSGVFECRDPKGNAALRGMEPPAHDDWDANRPEKGASSKIKKEFDAHIIDCIRKLTPASTETALVIPDLSRYLPDDGDTPEDAFDGPPVDRPGSQESFDRTPKTLAIPGRSLGRLPPTIPGGTTSGEGGGDAGTDEPDEGEEGEQGDDSRQNDRNEGDGDDSGPPGDEAGRTPVDVRGRAFLQDARTGVYTLVVHPPQPRPSGELILAITAVGDDRAGLPVPIRDARLPNKQLLGRPATGRIGPVSFPTTGPLRVTMTLSDPRRLAFTVTAAQVASAEETGDATE